MTGYRRPKPQSAWIAQALWGLFGIIVFALNVGSPGQEFLGWGALGWGLVNIAWVEWSERCENRALVDTVFGIILAVIAFLFIHDNDERHNS